MHVAAAAALVLAVGELVLAVGAFNACAAIPPVYRWEELEHRKAVDSLPACMFAALVRAVEALVTAVATCLVRM